MTYKVFGGTKLIQSINHTHSGDSAPAGCVCWSTGRRASVAYDSGWNRKSV